MDCTLHYAAREDGAAPVEIIESLIDGGADVPLENDDKTTSLEIARAANHLAIVEYMEPICSSSSSK
jgi:ankyrin repeat protein